MRDPKGTSRVSRRRILRRNKLGKSSKISPITRCSLEAKAKTRARVRIKISPKVTMIIRDPSIGPSMLKIRKMKLCTDR